MKFEWSNECQEAFDKLKIALTSYPVLRQPVVDRKFILHTDASGFAIGAILSQKDEENKEYVCAYASRLLKKAELNYGITEKECLAVVYGIKSFRIYLYGTVFKVITDHSALAWLMKIKEPTGRLARWSINLQAYTFEIEHRKGARHTNVDALSRPVLSIELQEVEEPGSEDNIKITKVWDDDALMHYMKYGRQLKGLSNKKIKRVLNMAKVYIYKDDKIWVKRKGKNLEVPKPDERREIIMRAHLLGQFQKLSTYHRLKDKYFWKNMLEEIEKAIRKCKNCIRNQKTNEVNNPANSLRVIGIFDLIGIDRTGNEFNNQLMKKLTSNIGVEHRVTYAYNPRTNGQTERFNQTLVNALRKYAELNKQLWNAWLPYVLLAYRSRVQNWSNRLLPNEEAALINRGNEKRELVERTQPDAVQNIIKNIIFISCCNINVTSSAAS